MQVSGMKLCHGCVHEDFRGCIILRREVLELGARELGLEVQRAFVDEFLAWHRDHPRITSA